jgi:ATP-dependent RNA helicase DeaD
MDHMRRGTLRLDKIKMVILDEADVMLDMGFREDIETILKGAPVERQTVFFSATMPRPIQDLIRKYSRDPQNVRIEQKELTVPTVEQVYYEVDRRFKIELLTRLIDLHDLRLGIIFCNTKRMVDDLVDHLNAQGYSADRLHGDMNQAMRDRVMNKFRKSGLEFLVATDVAARGIDVENVQVVFNYDLPYDVEDYLHRIGRTGRAGRSGRAISFASGREVFQIQHIERFIRVKMRRGKAPTAVEVEEARAGLVIDKVRATLKSGEYKRQDHLIERLLEEGFASTDVASALLHHLQSGSSAPPSPLTTTDSGPPSRLRQQPPKEFVRENEKRFDRRDERSPAAPSRQPWQAPKGPPPVRAAAQPSERSATIPVSRAQTEPLKRPVTAPAPAPSTSSPVSHPKPTAPKAPPAEVLPAPQVEHKQPFAARSASRRTPSEQTRLFMNVGSEMGIVPEDVIRAVQGQTGLPATVVGAVDIRERHLFFDVALDHASSIIAKLNRARIKDHKIKVKIA